jgi:putative ABC transport system permease protein
MSVWSRIANALSGDRLNRELDEEFEAHIQDAIAAGRDPEEARRAFGPLLRQRETSRRVRVAGWVESLRSDLIFGVRQLKRNRVTSVAAILSLGLAMGACVGAFRLVDALLWRPLPVAHTERLYGLWRQGTDFSGGQIHKVDDWSYPDFIQLREAAKGKADLLAASYTDLTDLTYATDNEMEKGNVQYVSGSLFGHFGLRPAAGRLLTEEDDHAPGAAPYAVLSYDYWTRRFGRDPKVVGRSMRIGDGFFQVVGVVDKPFTGVEPGIMTDVFLPVMMHSQTDEPGMSSFRTLVLMRPGVPREPLTRQLETIHRGFERERSKDFAGIPKEMIERFINQEVLLEPAGAGISLLQSEYRKALGALGVLVAMVLLIACTNVANLMTAQAAARAQEMALRVSIGAGRWRLVQLVLMESALLAAGAAMVGALFAWWSAPFVVSRIDTPNAPAHLVLPADWRVGFFALCLIAAVMLLFGLLPALRASSVKPVSALKGGDNPHARRRMMHGMIAAQVAFCFLVVFISGLFVASFERLSHRPLGFETDHVLLLESVAAKPQPPAVWEQVAESLRTVPGVERAATAGWPLLAGGAWSNFISIHDEPPGPIQTYFLTVSPGWVETMKIALLEGRDFRLSDTSPGPDTGTGYPGAAIVNETFAKTYFGGANPVGKSFKWSRARFEIVGLTRDAPYRRLREPMLPVAYLPFQQVGVKGEAIADGGGTFVIRIKADVPMTSMEQTLRQAVSKAHAGFRVSNLRTQEEVVRAQTVQERLLAMLALFFTGVALLLAGIGLYGVLNYSVLQRRREIGIRMAVGARSGSIARLVTVRSFAMILTGSAAGVALGLASARYMETLFYQVKATDAGMLLLPAVAILSVALVAMVPAIVRALHTDPVEILRAE